MKAAVPRLIKYGVAAGILFGGIAMTVVLAGLPAASEIPMPTAASAGSSAPPPTQSLAPKASPTVDRTPTLALSLTDDERRGQIVSGPRLEECSVFSTHVDEGPATIQNSVRWSKLTILGEVREIGGTRYNIPSGELTGERIVTMHDVYRPIIVNVQTVVQGEPSIGALKVRLPGGSIGCDTYRNDLTGVVDGAGKYVLFLSSIADVRGNPVAELTVVRAWLVDEDGLVHTPEDGTVTVEEFLRKASDR